MGVALVEAIRAGLKERRVRLPLAPGGYLRGSGLAELCPREEVLASREETQRVKTADADDLLVYAHGHGLHYALQNHVLPRVGVLVGRWICLNCGTNYGVPREPSPLRVEDGVPSAILEGVLVPRPERCGCGSTEPNDFYYRELSYAAPEYGTGGHPDGFLRLEGREGLGVFEAKSTSNLWEVRSAPYVAHAIQVQTYLWFTGLKWAVILYWHKGGQGIPALVEHTVERDDETIAQIKRTLREVWDGVEGGPLPGRICQAADSTRAKECKVRGSCFELPNPTEPTVLDLPPGGFDEVAAGEMF